MSENIEFLKVVKGTTAIVTFGLASGDPVSPDWSCHVQLRELNNRALAGVDRPETTVTQDNLEFIVELTASETDVDVGQYVLGAELNNGTTGEVLEGLQGIEICPEWVFTDP